MTASVAAADASVIEVVCAAVEMLVDVDVTAVSCSVIALSPVAVSPSAAKTAANIENVPIVFIVFSSLSFITAFCRFFPFDVFIITGKTKINLN